MNHESRCVRTCLLIGFRVGPCLSPVAVQEFADSQQTSTVNVVSQCQALPGLLKGFVNPIIPHIGQTRRSQRGEILGKLAKKPEIGLAAPTGVRPVLNSATGWTTHGLGVHGFFWRGALFKTRNSKRRVCREKNKNIWVVFCFGFSLRTPRSEFHATTSGVVQVKNQVFQFRRDAANVGERLP